jgi:long-chain acyl-CoA synthetase
MDWRDAEATYDDEVIARTTLARMFEESAARNADRAAQRYKGGVYDRSLVAADALSAAPAGEYADLTYAEMRDIVRNLAAGFRDLGVRAGDRVGVYSNTRMEWAQTDFALLAAGGVVTTVYTSSSEQQVRYLLDDPEATGVVVENADLLSRVLAVEDDLDLEFVVVVDEIPDGSGMAGAVRDRPDVVTLGQLHERGRETFAESVYESWLDARDPEDLASLIYTSGTTGQPKGVQLTNWNFRSNVNQCYRRFAPRPDKEVPSIGPGSVTLSFLPLAHVFERLAGHFLMFAAGATVAYAENPDTLREDFQLVGPTTGASVPRVYEKLYDAIRAQANESPVTARIFEWAVEVGREYQAADAPGAFLTAKHRLADRLVFQQVREALGGRVDFFISGGGSLSAELCALFHGMGLPILEGYGLTETSPVVAVNPLEEPKVGTIGPPVEDVEIALDDTVVGDVTGDAGGEVGELLVRGPNVTEGYWNRPEETERSFTDSAPASDASGESQAGDASGRWFRTGDVVELRPDGYISFRERAKQILVLSTGKNVAPGPIEDAFASSDVVEQCMVLGDGRKFVSALVVPNFEGVREWASKRGFDLPDDPRDVCRDDRVRARIQDEIDEVNEQFEPYEQIKQFRLAPEEFTEANDLLTPTMKKKRRHILERYADEIEMIYRDPDAETDDATATDD